MYNNWLKLHANTSSDHNAYFRRAARTGYVSMCSFRREDVSLQQHIINKHHRNEWLGHFTLSVYYALN